MTKSLLVTAGLTAFGATGAHAAHMAYTLGNNGNTLVTFAPDGSGVATAMAITGTNLPSLDAITYRPETGQLYGFSSDDDQFWIIDPSTGAATAAFASDIDVLTNVVSMDFNPTLDAVRLVTDAGDNLVYNPNAGTITRVNDLTYDEGYDPALAEPLPVGNGYTNQIGQAEAQALGTTQYVLDAQTDTIGVLNNNDGDIDFRGDVGTDFTATGGFDVFTAPDGSNIGYALLTGNDGTAFYEVDLGSFVFTRLFETTDEYGVLTSLAVFVPDMAPVPVPAAGLLFLTGAGGFAAMRRRKKTA
nr:DUF4394 domain-containing protein [Parvularcula dongshanensis]